MSSSTGTWRVNWLTAIKAAAFVLLVPGIVVVAIPLLILSLVDGGVGLGSTPWKFVGFLGLLGGAVLYLLCVVQLAIQGDGIPAPVQPTNNLVQTGPYGISRNPMYIAGTLFLWGEAVAFHSYSLAAYALAVMIAYYIGVVWLEEPALRQRFGEIYDRYRARVPRWLPAVWRGTPIQRVYS